MIKRTITKENKMNILNKKELRRYNVNASFWLKIIQVSYFDFIKVS